MLQTIVMVPRAAASLLHCATLASALFASEAVIFPSAQATQPNPIPTPNLLPPRTSPRETSALFSEKELALLSPYLQHLPTRVLAPELTKNLILAGKMTPERTGVVLDQKHLMLCARRDLSEKCFSTTKQEPFGTHGSTHQSHRIFI
jgi:hypothetical protein